MMFFNFKRFMETNTGRYILSMILGIGLASLFRKACLDRKCLAFKAAPINEVVDQTFKFGDKCYKFVPKPEACKGSGKKVVEMSA